MAQKTFEQADQARDDREDQGRQRTVPSVNCCVFYLPAVSVFGIFLRITTLPMILNTSLVRGRHDKGARISFLAVIFIWDAPGAVGIRPAVASTITLPVSALDGESPEAILYVKR